MVLSLLWGCRAGKQPVELKNDHLIAFNFVQLNDVYEIAPLGGGAYGGMARVAYLADSLKKANPNTFLVLAGDFLNPSLLATLKYQGERIKGRQMVEVMNAMDFDLVTFGNHEFDLSQGELQQRLNESRFPWMSSNVSLLEGDSLRPFEVPGPDGRPEEIPRELIRTIRDADGTVARIGFYGSTLKENPVAYVDYGDVLGDALASYNRIKPDSDIIIGFTHLSIAQDKELAAMCPETALIMGGHEHNNMKHRVGSTVIAKADANARTVYLHQLLYNKLTDSVELRSTLIPIDDKLPEKPEVAAVVDKWEVILEQEVGKVIPEPRRVIYTANPPLDGTDTSNRSQQTNLGALITAAMIEGFQQKPQAAIVNSGSFRLDDTLEGAVTGVDIMRVLPFGGYVVRVDVTGELLIRILEYGESSKGSGAYLHRGAISRSSDGKWRIEDKEIKTGQHYYTIAMSDFLLKGYDIPFLTADNPGILRVYKTAGDEPAADIRKAVIHYLKSL